MLVQGILSFPTLFTPKVAVGATEAKFSVGILIPPTDPQVQHIQGIFDAAVLSTYPNGLPNGTDVCWSTYDQKYQSKDYYDQRFSGWWVLTCTAKADDRPKVVGLDYADIIDPSAVPSGTVGHVNLNITGYIKGRGGIGGWLNGVMSTGEIGSMGRLDNKPTTEQMFAAVPGTSASVSSQPAPSAPPAPPAPVPSAPPAPVPSAPPAPPTPPAPPVHQMLPAAKGATYEAMIAENWTDELLVQHGMMAPPPSFA